MAIRFGLLALAAALLSGCGKPAPTSVYVDPALAALLPNDTTTLVGIRVKDLRESPLFPRLERSGILTPLEDFVNRTGFDPSKDLLEILLASDGKESLVMARGKFAETGQEPKIAVPGQLRFAYRGFPFFGTEETAVMFANASSAVAGKTESLRRIIDNRDKPGAGPPVALLEQARTVPWGNEIWLVSQGVPQFATQTVPSEGNIRNLRRLGQSLERVAGGLDLSTGLTLDMVGESPDESSARQVAGAVKVLVGLMKMQAGAGEGNGSVWDAFRVEVEGNRTRVTAAWDLEQANRLLDAILGAGAAPE